MRAGLISASLLVAVLSVPASAPAATEAHGDFNGDGRADLVVGAPDESVAGDERAGAVSVVYGSRDVSLRAATSS